MVGMPVSSLPTNSRREFNESVYKIMINGAVLAALWIVHLHSFVIMVYQDPATSILVQDKVQIFMWQPGECGYKIQ
jgi:hypothetical protein